MPQKITCGSCGEVLYDEKDLKPPEEVIQQLKGVCPRCGKKLSFDPAKVDIRVMREGKKDGRR